MSTDAERRYALAKEYVNHAVATVLALGLYSPVDQIAARDKTAPVISDANKIEKKWLRATSDKERDAIAREAENLADRTKENLPGAPSNWKRTNVYRGEVEKQTPATNYAGEVVDEATLRAKQVGGGVGALFSGLGGAAKLALAGGAIFLGWKLVSAFTPAERRR